MLLLRWWCAFLLDWLRCDWMNGCAGMPVRYRAVAIDGMALSWLSADWPGRAD